MNIPPEQQSRLRQLAGWAGAMILPAGSLYLVWILWIGKNRLIQQILTSLKEAAGANGHPLDETDQRKELNQLDYYDLLKVKRLVIQMAAIQNTHQAGESTTTQIQQAKELYAQIKEQGILGKMNFTTIQTLLFGT